MAAPKNFHEFLEEHIDNLQVEGDLAMGKIDGTDSFDEFRLVLRKYGFNFTTRSSRKEYYTLEDGKGGEKKNMPGRGSLMFKSSSDVSVPFFGSPFVVERTVYYTCSQGLKYYASKRYPDEMFREGDPLAKRRRRAKTTQKIGCQARMTVKKIKVFTSPDYFVQRDNWREKKAAIFMLRKDLEANVPLETIIRYCVLLSMDATHNHPPVPKGPPRTKKNLFDPARKVLKLHEQFQEALLHLNSDLVSKCTNMTTLIQCCNNLKQIINSLKDSIERNDGIPQEDMKAAMGKLQERQLKCCINAEKRAEKERKNTPKVKVQPKIEVVEYSNEDATAIENNENGHVIELPGVIDGAQVIWDPVSVSWIPDGQGLVLQQDPGAVQRGVNQSILLQRRVDDTSNIGVISQGDVKPSILLQRRVDDGSNIGVISQGGQNYTILQHSSVPNLGVSVPLTMTKVEAAGGMKKQVKRGDVGVAIAIPAGVEWTQQNWGQQLVVSDQFQQVPSQTVWNIVQ